MKKVLEVKNITKIYKIYKSNFDRLKEIFTKKTYQGIIGIKVQKNS
ncbi:MAG: hypothetical protein RBR33_06975 [Sulfurovaceae bacterium]|nr:hypothetical protein [Sulfurovaceae bacterium]